MIPDTQQIEPAVKPELNSADVLLWLRNLAAKSGCELIVATRIWKPFGAQKKDVIGFGDTPDTAVAACIRQLPTAAEEIELKRAQVAALNAEIAKLEVAK